MDKGRWSVPIGWTPARSASTATEAPSGGRGGGAAEDGVVGEAEEAVVVVVGAKTATQTKTTLMVAQ